MTALVLDASVTMAWFFEETRTKFTDAVLDSIREDRAVVPGLWSLEVANAIAVSERRGLVSETQIRKFLGLLEILPKEVHHHEPGGSFGELLSLARRHGLTSYDAAYLEISMRLGHRLATLDKSLKKAAEKVGAAVFRE